MNIEHFVRFDKQLTTTVGEKDEWNDMKTKSYIHKQVMSTMNPQVNIPR